MSQNSKADGLENLKKALQIAEQKKEQAFFVFDVDSTLFCMRHRMQAIIRDCVKCPHFRQKFAEHLKRIQKVVVTDRDWSIQEIMSRHGFVENDPLVLTVEQIWKKKFFSNDYLHLDQPYKGSASYLHLISKQQVQLYYLTARNQATMDKGTLQSFRKWNLPLKHEKHLIMKKKSESHLSDAEYKLKYLKEMIAQQACVLFFENEPVILNFTNQHLPSVQLYWINSTHCRQEKPPQNALPLSMDYSLS